MKVLSPRRPSEISPYAVACFRALREAGLSRHLSIGGALGLFHYFEYRFPDLVAAKMTALVERGAPRDFLDIFSLCAQDIIEPAECWLLWQERQTRAGDEADFARAHLAIETHLERIALHRPLESIQNPEQRQQAETVRRWFREIFLKSEHG